MRYTINELKNEFNNITLMRLFEIEVLDKDNNTDYLTFDIELRKNTLYASHIPLTKKQDKSKKIAYEKIVLDSVFSLDEHLQSLHENCINAIIESDYYTLA